MGLLDRFARPPGKDRFARMLLDAIRKAGEPGPVRYDPEHFRLVREGEGKNLMNLANVYNEYCATPRSNRPALFKNFVRAWFADRRETPAHFEDVKHDLLPGVRNRASFEVTAVRVRAEQGEDKFDWPYRVLAGSLGVGLVYDLPESMMQVQRHTLE